MASLDGQGIMEAHDRKRAHVLCIRDQVQVDSSDIVPHGMDCKACVQVQM